MLAHLAAGAGGAGGSRRRQSPPSAPMCARAHTTGDGRPVTDAAILDRLNEIADGGVGNRITPFMAESALYALRALDARAAVKSK